MTEREQFELGIRLTCREVIDFVMAYLDGELPNEQRAIFDAHLAICADCRNYLASYEQTLLLEKDFAQAPSAAEATAAIPESLVGAILAARKKS